MTELVDIRLPEWGSLDPRGSSPAERELRRLDLGDAATRSVARKLTTANVLAVEELRDGIAVRATSFVGRIQLGRVRITVEPKIARAPLLSLFRYAFGLRRMSLWSSASAETGALFQDVLIEQLRAEVDELRRRGLAHRYVLREDVLTSPRGRLDVARLSARGGVIDASLPCRHAPRSLDHVLNRVLVAGIALGARLAQSPELRRELLALGRKMDPAIGVALLDGASLARARLAVSRLTASYEPSLTLVGLLLDGLGIDLGEGDSLAVPGFLFDMNRFFQALVERLLRDNLPGHRVHAEHGIRGMLAYVQNPRGRRAPQPRPDFTLREQASGTTTVLDAKYRDLWDRTLPRDMLYQLALYAVSQADAKSSAIIYPAVSPTAREASVEVRHPLNQKRIAMVHLRPLAMTRLASAVEGDQVDALARAAREVAFGAWTPAVASESRLQHAV